VLLIATLQELNTDDWNRNMASPSKNYVNTVQQLFYGNQNDFSKDLVMVDQPYFCSTGIVRGNEEQINHDSSTEAYTSRHNHRCGVLYLTSHILFDVAIMAAWIYKFEFTEHPFSPLWKLDYVEGDDSYVDDVYFENDDYFYDDDDYYIYDRISKNTGRNHKTSTKMAVRMAFGLLWLTSTGYTIALLLRCQRTNNIATKLEGEMGKSSRQV